MANETENRKLIDLRVVDLRLELERRDLDKTGVKAVLLERLQNALKEEGHDPDTYVFESSSEVKRTPGRGRKSDNEEVSEDDKGEDDEEAPNSEQEKEKEELTNDVKDNDINDTKENSDSKMEELKESKQITKEDETAKVQKSETDAKEESSSKSNTEIKETKNELNNSTENGPDEVKKDVETPKKSNEKQTKPDEETKVQSQEKSDVESKKSTDASTPDTDKKTAASEETTRAKTTVKEDKSTTEANGVIDNEDSINLTIGEDEAKMLADEEDSSQEKDHKDESQGSTSHKKTSVGEKSQDKTNQEKMDGKSSAVGEKASKEEKNKKVSASVGGSSRNLWVSGLATTTRATDLKQVFSKYGKVIGAKVVTNARTPGARCYGYVTMSNPDDANKAVQFLHHTELHGRLISVEKAKGDSTGPPKRTEPTKVESPVKKVEEKKKEPVVRKLDPKKEENIVPPGTEGELKEPDAPGTEKEQSETKAESKEGGHRSRETVRSSDRPEKRPRSATSSHRSRGGSPVLTFDKIKEERERQRLRERERILREEERRRETERMRQREIDRKQREEFERLDREKKKLKMERERLLREKDELLKLKSERQRLERERQKLEREKLEKEKEELERLKRQNMRLEEEARRKRSLSASRDQYESRKRPATDTRYVGHHSSSQSRYPEPRSSEYKKESSHKSSRELAVPPRRPGFESEPTRRMVTSVSSSRESWPPKDRDRDSGRYERSSVNSSSFREESISSRSKPSERLVRERYAEGPKSERFVERGESWHGSSSTGGSAAIKSFGSRDTWVSGERKPEHVSESWSRPSNNSTRWPGNSTSIGMSSRSGPQGGISSPMFATNNIQGMSGMGVGMSMGAFSGGDRFDAYKQPYFKGP